MKRTIFYSWQSDLDSKTNRSLIEDALERALKGIRKDKQESIEPVLDRDTSGLPGSPDIANSIFAKIALADAFVADVSIINSSSGERSAPNPNVLIELGYAVAQLGWEKILLVQNNSFGGPELLPFDLRGRRVITYELSSPGGEKAGARGLLQGRLESALKRAIGDQESNAATFLSGRDTQLWFGKWKAEKYGPMAGGELFVREVGPTGFLFDLSVFNGAHMGTATGYARIVSPDVAYARMPNGDTEEIGEILFRRSMRDRRVMNVQETASCWYYRGAGVSFNFELLNLPNILFDFGFVNELELARLYSLLGTFYDPLMLRMQGISAGDNADDLEARVLVGGVRGLFTIMEGIVMIGPSGEMWVAFIDDEVVRYFTTETKWKDTLPKTISEWRNRFSDHEVIPHHYTDRIPPRER